MRQEQAAESLPQPHDEPMLDLIHGLPGTGKSEVIAWLKELFHLLGWKHGVQYVCLAMQNPMAASIGGNTLHHWSGIPTAAREGKCGTKDTTTLSIKSQCLRFILIDEISMVSAELLSTLERVVQMVVKNRTLWKRRADGSERMFGGINVLFFGDWWQLKPVCGTPLFQSPFGPAGNVQKSLAMFWGQGRDSIHHTWELTELVRCKDRWYNSFLMGCRDGNLSHELYNFIHGFPTLTPGSFIDGDEPRTCCSSPHCREHLEYDAHLGWYRRDWKDKFLQGWCGSELMQLVGVEGDSDECR